MRKIGAVIDVVIVVVAAVALVGSAISTSSLRYLFFGH